MQTVLARVENVRRRMDKTGFNIATDVGSFTLIGSNAGDVADYILVKRVTINYDEKYHIVHFCVT